jgi:hypothetical protein
MDNELFYSEILPQAEMKLKRAKQTNEKQRNYFLDQLKNKRYLRNEKNEILVLDESGNIAENSHGWPMTGADAVEELFNLYFEDNKMPWSEDEYFQRLRNPRITPEERVKLTNWWQKNGTH